MKSKPVNRFLAALLATSGILATAAFAADSPQTYQDSNLLNTWNLTDMNWDAGTSSWGANNLATFAGTGETVTVGTVDANAITITSAGYKLSGGKITLGGTATITASQQVTISSELAGSAGMTKAGTGTLSLGGVNTYTGTTTIDAGTLAIGSSNIGTGTFTNHQFVAYSSTTGNSSGGNYSLGNDFTVAAGRSIVITQLGYWDYLQDGLAASHAVKISDTTGGTLFANATVASGTADTLVGGYRFHALGSNLTLSAGTYRMWADIASATDKYYRSSASILDTDGGAVSLGSCYYGGAGNAFPAFADGGSNYKQQSFKYYDPNSDEIMFSGAIAAGTAVQIGAAGVLNLAGTNQSIGSLNDFGGSGGTVNNSVAGTKTLTLTATSGTAAFSGVIANDTGNLALTQSGAGTQILTGANTYSGTTTINAGTLEIGGAGTLGSGGTYPATISSSGTLYINSTAAQTLSGVVSGGTLKKANTGTLTLSSATNGYNALTIDGGNVVAATGAVPAAAIVTINPGSTLSLSDATYGHVPGVLNLIGGTVSIDGSTQNAHNYVAKTLTMQGGTLTSANGPAGPANDGGWGNFIVNNSNLVVSGSTQSVISCTTLQTSNGGSFTVGDAVVGADTDLLVSANFSGGSLVKNGTGTMELTATNTSTGATTINAGTLKLSASGSIDSSPSLTVASGATLDVSATAGLTLASTRTLAGGGTVLGAIKADGGRITATGPLSVTSLTMNSSSTLNVVPGTGSLTITTTDGLNTGVAGNLMTIHVGISPITSGTYHLVQFSGTIQGADGFSAFQLGTTPGGDYTYELVANGSSVDMVVAPLAKLWTGALDSAWATAVLSSPKNWKTGVNPSDFLTGDDVLFDDSADNTTVSITAADVSPNSILFSNNSKTYTLQGTAGIAGATGLTKAGAGTLAIDNANSFTGAVTLNGGILTAAHVADGGSSSALGAGAEIIFEGGILAYSGSTASTNRLLTLYSPGTVDITAPGTALTLSGEITGSSSFIKSGAGTLVPGFDNTYNGATRITAGILRIATLPDGGVASPLGQSSNAAGNLVLAGGTLSYNGATATSNRGFTLTPATTSTLAVADPAAALTLSGPVAGNGNLAKAGPGTLVRSTTMNTYASLSVAEGKLSIHTGAYNGLSYTAPVEIAAGAVLSADNPTLNAHNLGIVTLKGGTLTSANGPAGPANDDGFGNWVVAGVTVTGSVPSIISSATLLIKTDATSTIDVANVSGSDATDLLVSAGIIEDGIYTVAAPLSKTGDGCLALTGRNTYTGNTTVNAGTLVLADDARLTFVIGNTSDNNNKLTGAGSVTLDGDFAINTSAVTTLTTGSWQLENVTSLTGAYGASFTVTDLDGTPWTNAGGDKWTKTLNDKTWSFDETTGTLTLGKGNFANWASTHGITGGPTGDSDHDGIPNLVEYALNLNPAGSDGSAGTFSGTTLAFTKRGEAVTNGDVTYTIETSSDLTAGSWTSVTPGADDATTISYLLPPNQGHLFARLAVKQVTP